ncbi:unnamed protein product [Urochloa humidicola]
MSSHAQQRASTVQLFGTAVPSASSAPAFGAAAASASMFGAPGSGFSFGGSTGAPSPFNGLPASSVAPTFGSRFVTPAMQSMVESSRKAREQQQSEPSGSLFGPK